VLNRTAAVGLLTEDGMIGSRVAGAIGLDTRTGKFVVCEAKAVVLVSGDSDRLARHHDSLYSPARFITVAPPTNCGDGHAMAYRAGADIVNMEFAYLSRMWKDFAHSGAGNIISTVGGRIITGRGRELAPADQYRLTCAGAFNTEGPIYLDMSGVRSLPDKKRAMQLLLWGMENGCTSAGNLLWINERGEDLVKNPIEVEWRPPAIHNNQAGVHIDIKARSSLEGLYCAGDVIGGGWRQATAGAFVFGARAGNNAAEYAKKAPRPKPTNEQVAKEKNRILEAVAINARDGYSWIELEDKIRKIATDYGPPFTNDAKLEQGLTRLEYIRTKYLAKLYARNPREMLRASELKSIFFMVEAFLRSASFRKESRQNSCCIVHKTDYPEPDNEKWLKHTLIQNLNGEMTLSTKEVKRLNKN
jgi:succinate dehydrogenase/fumarate reductase flavoprotein subunit